MTAIAVTAYGAVTGTNSELVAAAAELFDTIPTPRCGRTDRVAELLVTVRAPLDALI